jgi:hypothetical protein
MKITIISASLVFLSFTSGSAHATVASSSHQTRQPDELEQIFEQEAGVDSKAPAQIKAQTPQDENELRSLEAQLEPETSAPQKSTH